MGHLLLIRRVQSHWLWHQNPEGPACCGHILEGRFCSWWCEWAGTRSWVNNAGLVLTNLARVRMGGIHFYRVPSGTLQFPL